VHDGPREGFVCERGYRLDAGYCFLLDERERRQFFAHVLDNDEVTFFRLRPGLRVAFAAFERKPGEWRAHRVVLLP
jgi:cold shock CspA family protein